MVPLEEQVEGGNRGSTALLREVDVGIYVTRVQASALQNSPQKSSPEELCKGHSEGITLGQTRHISPPGAQGSWCCSPLLWLLVSVKGPGTGTRGQEAALGAAALQLEVCKAEKRLHARHQQVRALIAALPDICSIPRSPYYPISVLHRQQLLTLTHQAVP